MYGMVLQHLLYDTLVDITMPLKYSCPLTIMRLSINAVSDYSKIHEKRKCNLGLFSSSGIILQIAASFPRVLCTSSSMSTRTYWRVRGWFSKWSTVVISASLMRLSWQSITLFKMVLRPPRLATTSGFFRAAVAKSHKDWEIKQPKSYCTQYSSSTSNVTWFLSHNSN